MQTDAEISSDPTCSSAGCNYAKDKGKTPYPMNYFVPNFGSDKVIDASFDSLDWSEKKLGHKWIPDLSKKKERELNYFVPNFGVDEDIKMTQAHIDETQKKLKHTWTPVEDENGFYTVPGVFA
jgi:hypothetical protein